jgi:hypothetical protein
MPSEVVDSNPFVSIKFYDDDVEANVNAAAVTDESDLPAALWSSGSVAIDPLSEQGTPLLADTDAVVEAMSASLVKSVDLTEDMLPLPILEAVVSEEGKTAVITISADLSLFAGKKIGDLIVLKHTYDNGTVALKGANTLSKIVSEQYIFTNTVGAYISDTSTIAAATTYFLSVAVKDNSVYDWDHETSQRIVDPLVIAVRKEEAVASDKDTSIAQIWTEAAGKKVEGNSSGLIIVPGGTDVTNLPIWIVPTNAKAMVSPDASGDKYDFTSPRKFNVLAEDGTTSKDHTVTIEDEAFESPKKDEEVETENGSKISSSNGGCSTGTMAAIVLCVGALMLAGKNGRIRQK